MTKLIYIIIAIVIFGLSHGISLAEINDKLYAEDADTLC